jgi:hypothetical protein
MRRLADVLCTGDAFSQLDAELKLATEKLEMVPGGESTSVSTSTQAAVEGGGVSVELKGSLSLLGAH